MAACGQLGGVDGGSANHKRQLASAGTAPHTTAGKPQQQGVTNDLQQQQSQEQQQQQQQPVHHPRGKEQQHHERQEQQLPVLQVSGCEGEGEGEVVQVVQKVALAECEEGGVDDLQSMRRMPTPPPMLVPPPRFQEVLRAQQEELRRRVGV